MDTRTIEERLASPWQPITNPRQIKIIGKCIEELNEMSSALARVLIQGIDEVEPVTGKPNRQWLEEEYADMMVTTAFVFEEFGLSYDHIANRALKKTEYLTPWIDL